LNGGFSCAMALFKFELNGVECAGKRYSTY